MKLTKCEIDAFSNLFYCHFDIVRPLTEDKSIYIVKMIITKMAWGWLDYMLKLSNYLLSFHFKVYS